MDAPNRTELSEREPSYRDYKFKDGLLVVFY